MTLCNVRVHSDAMAVARVSGILSPIGGVCRFLGDAITPATPDADRVVRRHLEPHGDRRGYSRMGLP